jgi:tRNA (guanine37-N1)-methyltransferase
LRIDVITIFPGYLDPVRQSLSGKAIETGIVDFAVHDLRHWTHDVHRSVDDAPYGGGPGMVMKAPVWGAALDEICTAETLLVVPTPAGQRFCQADAQRWTGEGHLVFACGRYEGIDQRVVEHAKTRAEVMEVSLGDYVLNGGEVAALAMIEAITRLIPGFMGNAESIVEESHSDGLLEYPSYTKPQNWRGLEVPDVLLSGHHAEIAKWRKAQSVERTKAVRPDLLAE